MTAVSASDRARDLARGMSLFEIDQTLELLIESAQEEASANGGEIPEQVKIALADYIEAFGEKVDRIANYLKIQEAVADLAKREAARLDARRRAAENRARGLKDFLCVYMAARNLKQLRGKLNNISLASNSVESLILDESFQAPDTFQKVAVEIPWDEWRATLAALPPGALRDRLSELGATHKTVDRLRVTEALKAGTAVPGARLVRGRHIRVT